MAMYIKISINGEGVAVFAAKRKEPLDDEDKEYTYEINKYDCLDVGFARSETNIKALSHKYSDGAEILAEKILHAFNN